MAQELPSKDVLALFSKRQSVRKFKSDPVPEEHLKAILDAARYAPTSGNQQPWKFLVIREKATIAKLKAAVLKRVEPRLQQLPEGERAARLEQYAKGQEGYYSAPVYVVVLTDNQSQYPTYNHFDGPMAAAYLMLAARALGYGTVFLTDSIPEEVTKEVLQIPDRYTRVCITPIGVPEAWPAAKAKRKLEEMIAYEKI